MNSDIPGENETPLSVPAVLQQAFDALPYAVIVGTSRADPHGARIVYVNDALTDLLHYTRQELLGRPPPMLDAYQAPSEAAKFDVYDSDLDRARSFEGTFWSYPKDGDPIRLTWGVSPLRDEAGRVVGFIGIHASATLTESDDRRGRLVAGAEIDAPIARRRKGAAVDPLEAEGLGVSNGIARQQLERVVWRQLRAEHDSIAERVVANRVLERRRRLEGVGGGGAAGERVHQGDPARAARQAVQARIAEDEGAVGEAAGLAEGRGAEGQQGRGQS